jgi:hypothetical protein
MLNAAEQSHIWEGHAVGDCDHGLLCCCSLCLRNVTACITRKTLAIGQTCYLFNCHPRCSPQTAWAPRALMPCTKLARPGNFRELTLCPPSTPRRRLCLRGWTSLGWVEISRYFLITDPGLKGSDLRREGSHHTGVLRLSPSHSGVVFSSMGYKIVLVLWYAIPYVFASLLFGIDKASEWGLSRSSRPKK